MTPEALERLPVKDGFRLRGLDMTRTETFTDAAFAFAVTLLVVSIDQIPTSYDELVNAMLGIPAFAASFALIALFWYAHWKWSRRYGLEDLPTILLSFSLVFLILCYIYPLKYLFNGMATWLSGGRIQSAGQVSITLSNLYSIFAIYGAGFVALCIVIILLNLHAYRKREELKLNAVERFDALGEAVAWSIVGGVGVVSLGVALFTPPSRLAIPGFVYVALPIVMPIHGALAGRKRRALTA